MSTLAVWTSLFWFFPFTPIFKQNHLKSFAITLTVTDSLLAVWPTRTFPTTEHAWRLECHGRLLKMFACTRLNSCPGWQDCSVRKMGSENWGAHLLELKFRLARSCQLSVDLFPARCALHLEIRACEWDWRSEVLQASAKWVVWHDYTSVLFKTHFFPTCIPYLKAHLPVQKLVMPRFLCVRLLEFKHHQIRKFRIISPHPRLHVPAAFQKTVLTHRMRISKDGDLSLHTIAIASVGWRQQLFQRRKCVKELLRIMQTRPKAESMSLGPLKILQTGVYNSL